MLASVVVKARAVAAAAPTIGKECIVICSPAKHVKRALILNLELGWEYLSCVEVMLTSALVSSTALTRWVQYKFLLALLG